MATIKAKFNGHVFVPCEPVDLPVGSAVEIIVPRAAPGLTPEEMKEWEEIQRQIDATEPHFATVDEAMRYLRKRP
jgi:hypothetical protein